MKNMKMIIPALALAGCMMCMTASAAEKKTYDNVGIEMPVVECPEDMEGMYTLEAIGPIDEEHHVYGMDFIYATKPEKELIEVLNDPELSEEEVAQARGEMISVFKMVFATDRDIEAVQKAYETSFGGEELLFEDAREVGSA